MERCEGWRGVKRIENTDGFIGWGSQRFHHLVTTVIGIWLMKLY